MKKLLIIIGAGGLGKEIVDIVQSLPERRWVDLAFVDDAIPVDTIVHGIRVLGSRFLLQNFTAEEIDVCIAIGSPLVRKEMVAEIQELGLPFATIVDPTALIRSTSVLGTGVIISARTFISCNSSVGAHVVVNPGAIVGHDVVIGSYAVVGGGANISGGASVGEGSLIGAGACILGKICVGEWCKVGMGAAVYTAVPDGLTVVGNPARPLPTLKKTAEGTPTRLDSPFAARS